ncbi:MAG: hypothetical protein N4A50_02740 [Vallitalea sp.]|jgi:YD repeat-containing protein|nr:hypothetical protein [Vallitalea sp.]
MIFKTEEKIKEINILKEPITNFGIIIPGQTGGYTEHAKELYETAIAYTYDGFNQMTKITTGDKVIAYRYNGEGLRVEKKLEEEITRHLYEQDKVVYEADDKGKQETYMVLI